MFTKQLIISLTVLGLLASCKKEAVSRPTPPAPEVLVATAEMTELNEVHTIIGQTNAFSDVKIQAKVEGYITEVAFKDGGPVTIGQVLYKIDPRPYEALVEQNAAKVTQNEASMIEAKSKYERNQVLHKKGAVSDQDLDNALSAFKAAEAAIAVAKADLQYAKLNLEYTTIKAPIDGKMGIGHVSKGNYVTPLTGELAHLVGLQPIYVDINISEKLMMTSLQKNLAKGQDLLTIKKDQIWDYSLILSNDTPYDQPGKLDSFNNEVSASTGTLKVRLEFANPSYLLAPNQYVKLQLKSKEKFKKLIIPQSAIMSDQTGDYIYTVNAENTVIRVPVLLGERRGVNVIVEKGLEGGEKVIYQGTQKSRPGGKVVPKSTDNTPPQVKEDK